MEDVVAEAESLLHPINPRRSDGEVIEERQNPEPEAARQEKEGEERVTGFINHLISSLGTGGDAADEEQEENQTKQAEKETITAGGESEEKGGGLLDQIISNLVIPLSPKTSTPGKVEAFDATSENESGFRGSEEEMDGGGGGGGLINNIMSNLFHHSESEGEVRESGEESKKKEKVKVGEENKAEKTGEDGGEGGIIDNIVSHLPASLPDGAAPTSDEATILIHIVQD